MSRELQALARCSMGGPFRSSQLAPLVSNHESTESERQAPQSAISELRRISIQSENQP